MKMELVLDKAALNILLASMFVLKLSKQSRTLRPSAVPLQTVRLYSSLRDYNFVKDNNILTLKDKVDINVLYTVIDSVVYFESINQTVLLP